MMSTSQIRFRRSNENISVIMVDERADKRTRQGKKGNFVRGKVEERKKRKRRPEKA